MDGFVASAAANTVGNLATEYASPYVSYFFKFGKIIEDFKHRRNLLELKRNQVKDDVNEAIRQMEEIKKDVQDWLTRAETELVEAQNLEDEIERNKCFKWCPNWGWRYCLSKKVAKKTLCISRLLENPDFGQVGIRPPLQGIEFLLSNDVKHSESSKAAFNGIMKALSSDGVNIIGLYGMPGVGKTTLVQEVGKQAREQKLFDKAVIFTMSQTPNINEIQDRIAEILGLTFRTTTKRGKAEELWRKLKDEKKILIIIDDVWNGLELKHIGIPFGAEHEGCKILLTTRLQQVCTQMNCQEKFKLNVFSQSEAWDLFKDNAGLENASPTLNDVAKEVARECKGLPLAIVTMARTLKDETDLDRWEIVNQRLKESRHSENQDVCEVIYNRLKISYDYLKGTSSRTCLQLCSLFPEDHTISVDELTIYGIGRGLFHDVNSIEDARREMRVTITNLQKSGLLLETNNDVGFVKMHDVVRDFVHWITSEGEKMVLVKSGLKEWPRTESFVCYPTISLIKSDINNFPDGLEFPKLEAFLLDEMRAHGVPRLFFQGMKALKVLVLRFVSLSLEGLQFLPNLRTLQLENCKPRNASSLGNLKKLEILIIGASYEVGKFELLEVLNFDLTGLTTLRLLTIYGPESIAFGPGSTVFNPEPTVFNPEPTVFSLPKNLLSSLVQLEELYLGLPIEWSLTQKSVGGPSVSELRLLPRLTRLSLQVLSESIPEKFVFPPLQRYDIAINEERFYPYHWHKSSRRLTITKFSLTAFEKLFHNVEEFALTEIMDLEYLIATTKGQGPKSPFNNLVRLTLDNMICLKELCHGPPPIGFLENLEFLTIKNCPNLVFEIAAINNLKELRVEDCGHLQVIFQDQTQELYNHDQSKRRLLTKLQELIVRNCKDMLSVVPATTNLEKVTAESCAQLQVIFQMEGCIPTREENEKILLLSNLKQLELGFLPKLRCIWKGPTHHVNLQSLKVLKVCKCDKLSSLFSPSLAQTLFLLEQLQIQFCGELAHIISPEPARDYHGIVSNTHPLPLICWPKLRTLIIRNCQKLEYVFPITLAQGLQQLKLIEIINSPQLKQLFNNMAEEKGNGQDILLPRLQFLVLEDLENLSSLCQRNYFVMSPSLKIFEVRNCPKLTDFTVHLEVALQAQAKGFQLYGFKEMICCSKNLTLNRTRGCKNLIPDIDPEGLNELTFLQLHNFGDLQCLYDTKELTQPMIAFSNLVELVMEEMIGLKNLCNSQPPNGFLQKLEKLKIINCKNMASLSLVGQNLKEVMIKDCGQLQEIFQVDEILHSIEANQAPLLSNLTLLELKSLSELRCIWKEPFHSVINLLSLKIVKISNCNRLRCLFSPSLVKNLVHLEQLILHDLPELEQLITKLESDVEQEKQVFNKVKEMVDGQHKLFLPSLNKFGISKCPRLAPFVIQQEVNNQAQVKGLYLSNRRYNSFDILLRQSLPNLEHFTVGNHLQFLQWLIVSNCNKLKSLFSPMLAQSLPHLSYLYIEQCKELEQIVAKDKTSASSSQGHLQSICFPSLIGICIEECSSLKSLFSVSVTLSLSQLQWLTIRGASKLGQVFEYQGGIDIEDTEKEIVLPRLRRLSLEELPRLKSFAPMGYHCSFPRLLSLKVEKCPNLTTSFSTDSEFTIHARTKAVGDVSMEVSTSNVDIMEVCDRDDETIWLVGSDINWIHSRWR